MHIFDTYSYLITFKKMRKLYNSGLHSFKVRFLQDANPYTFSYTVFIHIDNIKDCWIVGMKQMLYQICFFITLKKHLLIHITQVQKTLSVAIFFRLMIAFIENITFGNNSHSFLKLYHERHPWFVLFLF